MNKRRLFHFWDIQYGYKNIIRIVLISICWLIYLPVIFLIINDILYIVRDTFVYIFRSSINMFNLYKYGNNYKFWNIFRFWIPAILFSICVIVLLLIDAIFYINYHHEINYNLLHKIHHIKIFNIFKYLIFTEGLYCITIYFIILVVMFFFWWYMSIKSNKYNQITNYKVPLKIDVDKLKVDIFKFIFDYIFTIINTIIATISILLALENELVHNKMILYFSIAIIPVVSGVKFLQIWYSFRLPKNFYKYYSWDEVYKIYSILWLLINKREALKLDEYKWFIVWANIFLVVISYMLKVVFNAINNLPIISSIININNIYDNILNLSKTFSFLVFMLGLFYVIIYFLVCLFNDYNDMNFMFGLSSIACGLGCLFVLSII